MRVKTFDAVDMKQALNLVRRELGPRAVIVSSRAVRRDGGLFGMLGRKVLEVTAAAEEDAPAPPSEVHGARPAELGSAPRTAAKTRAGSAYHDLWAVKQAVDPLLDEVRAMRETMGELEDRVSSQPDDLRSDLAQIRTMLASMVASGSVHADAEGAAAQRLFYFLLGRGVDEPLVRSLVQRVVSRVESGGLGDLDRLKLNLAAEMRLELGRAERRSPPSRVQLFVGPTGVGKTTTIAKLAMRAARSGAESVQVITTDVHRVAAVEQMIRFGEILQIPVEVAIGPDDLRRAIENASEKDRIFVDTSGRSHRDRSSMRSLASLLDAAGEAETLLVMSATTRAIDSAEILDAYAEIPWSRLVMTKLDETRVYGELYNCVVRSGRPIACVTNGQAVPEHLESLDIPGILRMVLHG